MNSACLSAIYTYVLVDRFFLKITYTHVVPSLVQRTSLHMAAAVNQAKIASLLLDAGADHEARTAEGVSA